jgi:retron-type reverse transcriptase
VGNRAMSGRTGVSAAERHGKPFVISKHLVWEAYEKVKANKGAAGVDGQSLAKFEKDLQANLYKIWNRMSSGTYFPPRSRRWRYRSRKGEAPER